MNDNTKSVLTDDVFTFSAAVILVVIVIVFGLCYGCHEKELSNQTAIKAGLQQDQGGRWVKEKKE